MCVCLCVCIGGETCLKDQAEMTVGSGRGEGGMPLKRVDRVQFHDHPTGYEYGKWGALTGFTVCV